MSAWWGSKQCQYKYKKDKDKSPLVILDDMLKLNTLLKDYLPNYPLEDQSTRDVATVHGLLSFLRDKLKTIIEQKG